MMVQVSLPCDMHTSVVVHIIAAVFIGLNMLLTTWLTLRAKRRDKKEANGDAARRGDPPLA